VSVNTQGVVRLFLLVIPFEIVEKLGLKLRKSIGYSLQREEEYPRIRV
jgi:hypothetical protein